MNMCTIDSLNSTVIPYIYAYYTTKNYTDIFEDNFKEMEPRCKCVMILCVFKYLLDTNNLPQLKVLASTFAKIMEAGSIMNLFQLFFQYININESNTLLLKHMVPFMKKIKAGNKRQLKIFIDEKISHSLHENVAIKQFLLLLR
ncbi:PREDICTED: uncharacterized protein LOC108567362 [Nicrophorus vespilloides]|uniref:Uncharacterized protein LOC108567362 n=1 Tax=Nicrophorus vespilloides TaxID=110193 RepID=A0ABM1N8W7_NICVS|nr:PREDICTED: uncharacterized protein LOC108567362 [Nicrophorus vespilloides]